MISISLRSIPILSSHLCLRLPNGLFHVGVSDKILKALLISILNLLALITLTILGEQYKLSSSSLWSLLHFPSWGQKFASGSCFQDQQYTEMLKYQWMQVSPQEFSNQSTWYAPIHSCETNHFSTLLRKKIRLSLR